MFPTICGSPRGHDALPLPATFGFVLACCAWLTSAPARAQVTEPNGTVVPGPPSHDSEMPLSTFFEAEGEAIDAVTTASIEPGTFSPRCDFEATLVLSESQAAAGLAWYNVPDDPFVAPSAIYELLAPTTETGTVISSADIITSPDYAGGLIGFALTKSFDNGATIQAIYYSEYQRNQLCSECAMPDHWKMMLVYGSTLHPNTFYLAFEDWRCAASGACVEPGCEATLCETGSLCQAGSCVDACQNAVCPGGAECVSGQCDEPEASDVDGASSGTHATSGGIVNAGGTFMLPPSDGGGIPIGAGGSGATAGPAAGAGERGAGETWGLRLPTH